jgi:putative ABC transport system permease protein
VATCMGNDLKLGARRLAREPWLALVAVVTMGLGLGANIAAFSFITALFLSPVSAPGADRLVRLSAVAESGAYDVLSWPNVEDIGRRSRTLAAVAAHQRVDVGLGRGDERVSGELVSGSYFALLGLQSLRGRLLSAADADAVVVVSEPFWRSRLGADPDAIGHAIVLEGVPFTVVGVTPDSFRGSYGAFPTDFWAPLSQHETLRPRSLPLTRRGWGWLFATARLKDGVSLEEARGEVRTLGFQLAADYPRENGGLALGLAPATALPESMQAGATKVLCALMIVVTLVLLVAATNAASSLLLRVLARRREMAVRTALGASRARLVRLWLIESGLIASAAGLAGLVAAGWMTDGLLALRPFASEFAGFGPRIVFSDTRVLAFSFLAMLAAGFGIGVVPALRASRPDVAGALRQESGSATLGPSGWLRVFVVAQVAASATLVLMAGLLLRSVHASRAFDPGFDTERLVVGEIHLGRTRPGVPSELMMEVLEQVRHLPGVTAVTAGFVPPLGDTREEWGLRIAGFQFATGAEAVTVNGDLVGPSYFSTLGIPLVRGRDFTAADMAPSVQPVAVVNETMARRYWPNGDALGGQIFMERAPDAIQVVGIARDIKYYTLGEAPRPYLYLAAGRFGVQELAVFARTAGPAAGTVAPVRVALRDRLGPSAVLGAQTFEELRELPLLPGRILGAITTALGGVALLLATIGLSGLVAHAVRQRTREFGIRMALGAAPWQILNSVVGQGMVLAAIGIALGLAAAWALGQPLAGMLFGVSLFEPAALLPLGALLVFAFVACFVPARRATRMDPVAALRND